MIASTVLSESDIWPVCNLEIYLDGVKQEHCFYADDEKGYIWVNQTDKNGKFTLIKEKKTGKVEIRLKGEGNAA
jgi:hypothetical protein